MRSKSDIVISFLLSLFFVAILFVIVSFVFVGIAKFFIGLLLGVIVITIVIYGISELMDDD